MFQPPCSKGTTVMTCGHDDTTTMTAGVAPRSATPGITSAPPQGMTTATMTACSTTTATVMMTPHGATIATVTLHVAWLPLPHNHTARQQRPRHRARRDDSACDTIHGMMMAPATPHTAQPQHLGHHAQRDHSACDTMRGAKIGQTQYSKA